VTIVRRPAAATASLIAAGIPPVLARVYAARGIVDAAQLDHSLAALPDFAGFANIDAAADRLAGAIANRERIVIVADYDADGATACAVGVRGLRAMGADVSFLVPNRFEFGYGLTPEIVAVAAAGKPRIIVTVDNGIASVEGVAAAAAAGIDVVITDHHLPGAALPAPAIIVDPNQPGCSFRSKHIAGVGVMFYVLCALRARLRARGFFAGNRAEPNLAALLDLVALGTVADVVRLDQVNRIFVEQGLARIRGGRAQPGITALFAVAGRDVRRASASDLGFVVGPRLNAAGRLADMSLGIQCLLAEGEREADPMARELDRLNRDRRDIEAMMQDEALADVDRADLGGSEGFTICVHRPEWHQGVAGIVASRLKDRYHRPVLVFARGGEHELKGSGRSITGFHLRDALDLVSKRAPGTVLRFGGHAFAAGLSIPDDALARFGAAFESVARETLSEAQLRRIHESDGALAPGELTLELGNAMGERVWGQGFPPPAFDDCFDVIAQRAVGDGHAKLTVARGGEQFAAIAFRAPLPIPPRIHALFRAEVNHWNGLQNLELVIEHWSAA
jgi:single-stranded-DNA-specific exonuclease